MNRLCKHFYYDVNGIEWLVVSKRHVETCDNTESESWRDRGYVGAYLFSFEEILNNAGDCLWDDSLVAATFFMPCYKPEEVRKFTGVTRGVRAEWIKRGVLIPEVPAPMRGSATMYSVRNVVEIFIIKAMSSLGTSIDDRKRVISFFREEV
jgi:hypothetical protein